MARRACREQFSASRAESRRPAHYLAYDRLTKITCSMGVAQCASLFAELISKCKGDGRRNSLFREGCTLSALSFTFTASPTIATRRK